MPDNDSWHDAALGDVFKGLTSVFARVDVEPVRDPERRCYKLQVTWAVKYRTSINVALINQLHAKAVQDVQDMVTAAQQAGVPFTPQLIAEMETELQIPTLVPGATYGHERQHRIAVQQQLDAAMQAGGPLQQALALAERVCTSEILAERFGRVWRRWFLRRLGDAAARGAGHDNDPSTPNPPDGIGVPLPAGVPMPPETSTADWAADTQSLGTDGYVLIAPRA